MPILPRLKAVPVHGHGGTLVLCRRSLERIHLDEPNGAILALLRILARGDHSLDQLPSALAAVGHAATAAEVSRMVKQLDDWESSSEPTRTVSSMPARRIAMPAT